MSLHPLSDFEIQRYYQSEPRFNGVYSSDNISKIKDRTYVNNFDEHSDIGTHWVALWVDNNDVTPKDIQAFINNKNITTNIFRIQALIMRGYFCIGFIDFMQCRKEFN